MIIILHKLSVLSSNHCAGAPRDTALQNSLDKNSCWKMFGRRY